MVCVETIPATTPIPFPMNLSKLSAWLTWRSLAVRACLLAGAACAGAAERPGTAAGAGRRLAIEGLNEPAANVKVSDFAGRDLTAEFKPETRDGRVTVDLTRPEQFVVKPRQIATMAIATQGPITLPGGVVVPLVEGPDASRPAKNAWFRLTFAASPMPAPWDGESDGYVTRLTFGLKRPPQLPASIQLAQPVIVKLGYEGLTGPELPPLAIEAAGLEHEKTIELRFQPRTAQPTLLVRSTISDVNLTLSALARLEVRPQQRTVLGLGLETVLVAVTSVQAHGAAQPFPGATPVALEISGGARPEAEAVMFEAGASTATFRLRSGGLGAVVVQATAGGLSGEAGITQRFPTGPLVATLLGAALGGLARRFVKGARRGRTGRRILEGLIVGLVAFVAGVLGVGYLNLPPAVVATEAGAFLVGALSGFAGVTVLESLGQKQAARE